MAGRQMRLDGNALMRALLLGGIGLAVYAAIQSGHIRHFINPAYVRFTLPGAWVLLVLSLVQLVAAVRFLPKGVRPAAAAPGPSTAVYLVFTITLLLGLTVSPVTLGSDVVERQGLNLGQRARQGAVVLTPGAGLTGTVAWLSSGLQGLSRGVQRSGVRVAEASPGRGGALQAGLQGAGDDETGNESGVAAGDDPPQADGTTGGELSPDEAAPGSGPAEADDPEAGGTAEPGAQAAPGDGPEGQDLLLDPYQGIELDAGEIQDDRLVIDRSNFFARVWDLWINPQDYEGLELEVTGFVSRFGEFRDDQLMVARLVVLCHVAHAMPDGLIASYDGAAALSEDTWVRVVGTMETSRIGEYEVLQMTVTEMEEVAALEDPYIYPPGFEAEDLDW